MMIRDRKLRLLLQATGVAVLGALVAILGTYFRIRAVFLFGDALFFGGWAIGLYAMFFKTSVD